MVGSGSHDLESPRSVLGHTIIYLFALAWFCFICGIYMMNFWLPTLVKEPGVSSQLHIGLLTAIPVGLTMAGMIVIAMHSDHTFKRHWHYAIPAFVGTPSLVGLNYTGENLMLWSIPTAYLKGPAVAPATALINSLGLLGGFVSPFTLGGIRTSTGSLAWGNGLAAGVLCLGAVVILPGMLLKTKANAAASLA